MLFPVTVLNYALNSNDIKWGLSWRFEKSQTLQSLKKTSPSVSFPIQSVTLTILPWTHNLFATTVHRGDCAEVKFCQRQPSIWEKPKELCPKLIVTHSAPLFANMITQNPVSSRALGVSYSFSVRPRVPLPWHITKLQGTWRGRRLCPFRLKARLSSVPRTPQGQSGFEHHPLS